MADMGRLEELKRKFDENPKRYFAPLANEYRKAGDAAMAIELCRAYLPQQPSHMSGYIVYGQALQDSGQVEESAAVFKQALALDPENVIALRQLGDIARASGDSADASLWYGKVLELDPRNEEVAAFVAEASGAGAEPQRSHAPERPAPPTIRPEPEPDASAIRLEDIVAQPDMQQMPILADEPAQDVRLDPGGDDELAQPFEVTEWPSAMKHAEAIDSDNPHAADQATPAADENVAWPAEPHPESTADAGVDESANEILDGPWHSSMTQEFEVHHESETGIVSTTSEAGSLNLADFLPDEPAAFAPIQDETQEPVQDGTQKGTQEEPKTESQDEHQASQHEPQHQSEPEPQHQPQRATQPVQAPPSAPRMPDSPFVTATMAELYVQQGLRGEALAVYRQLVIKRNDPEYHKRILELEAEERGAAEKAGPRETVREFFARIGAANPSDRVALAADRGSATEASQPRTSPLSELFSSTQPDAGDVAAAQRLSGAFGDGRTGSSRS
jgi:tetratricopeptide (TPR) repeat protein